MESVVSIILLLIACIIFPLILRLILALIGAGAKTAIGEGSFAENMNLALDGMGSFKIRINDTRIDIKNNSSPNVKEIEAIGRFPLNRAARIGFVTSVFDKSSGKLEPVISALEAFRELNNSVYQHQIEVGKILPNQGFTRWVRLGVILPDILQPPYSGKRDLVAILRMVDLDNPPPITHGFSEPKHPGLLWQQSLPFGWTFNEKGYSEAAKFRDEALAIALKIGVAVAMADGNLGDEEGSTLKQWVLKAIEPFSAEKQQALKSLYNKAMKDAYRDAQNGNLNLSTLASRLNEIGEKSTKYEAIELCFDIMSADGVADKEEMRVIQKVSEALELDIDEIEKMRDQKIISLDISVSTNASIEELLGIEASWNKEQTKKHLRSEFQKWNNRINTLAEGSDRDNAQRMLDLIAEARKKYA